MKSAQIYAFEQQENKMNIPADPKSTISTVIHESVQRYINDMNGHGCEGLYEMVLREVERPLLKCMMDNFDDNQSKCAELLGINRGTLRKKLEKYDLL